MLPSHHFLLGLVFSLLIFLIFPYLGLIPILLILASSILIDVDHYIYYIYKKKDFSLRKSYSWFSKFKDKYFETAKDKRANLYGGVYFLHGIEVILIFLLAGLFLHNYFFYVFVGFSFHLLFDVIELEFAFGRIDKFSLVNDYFKFKKMTFIGDLFD